MDATTFDSLSRTLGTVATRRGFSRLLGGAAAMGALGAGGSATLARNTGNTNGRDRDRDREPVSAQGKGKGKKITICYLNQTRTVKKKGYQDKYPGATKGACPGGGNPGGGNPGGGGGGEPQACTRWILSGGPSQTDKIAADDDLGVYNLSRGGSGIISEFDRKASVISPAVFDASVGDRINIVGYDAGGCRSLSPLWMHCVATGASRKVYAGYNGGGCSFSSGTFVNQEFIV